MINFGNLFTYSSEKGIIIPDTSEVKSAITLAFNQIFGMDVSTDASTPMGRFIEALTMLFVNACGVNAQNANGLNPEFSVGVWLDAIGGIFGVPRNGESDAEYRKRILMSQSRGTGFVQSMWNAVSKVEGVTSVCVLENGYADPMVLPNSPNGIAIDPHSIFICVAGGNDSDVAKAIYSAKSAGCAYHLGEEETPVATRVEETVQDDETGSSAPVIFYRPSQRFIKVSATVRSDTYTGTDIVADTRNAILAYIAEHDQNSTITESDILVAIATSGLGIVCTGVSMQIAESSDSAYINTETIVLRPYEFISPAAEDITVSV